MTHTTQLVPADAPVPDQLFDISHHIEERMHQIPEGTEASMKLKKAMALIESAANDICGGAS